MPPAPILTDALMLVGHGSLDPEGVADYFAFAKTLSERLGVVAQPSFLEFSDPPIAVGLRRLLAADARRAVVLPLFLGPAGHQKNDVPSILNWARNEWPQVQFFYGAPLGAQFSVVSALADRVTTCAAHSSVSTSETAVLVVGRGSRDPDGNSEVCKVSRLLWEGRGFAAVETAFYSLTGPTVTEGIEKCIKLGARQVVVAPYLLFRGRIEKGVAKQTAAVSDAHPNVRILVANCLGFHDGIFAAVEQRYREALEGTAAMNCDLCKYRNRYVGFEHEHGLAQTSDHHHGWRGLNDAETYESALEALLPPQYKNGKRASSSPMRSAGLKYDDAGNVAWGDIWQSFCDLALAGGPPHRGSLLEPALADDARTNPNDYERVVAEIERGIRLVSNLPSVKSKSLGWVGAECENEEMAIWMMRAIIVENICVRREGNVIYLPAGPDFRVEKEIKNVITSVAKTHHYWTSHIQSRLQAKVNA